MPRKIRGILFFMAEFLLQRFYRIKQFRLALNPNQLLNFYSIFEKDEARYCAYAVVRRNLRGFIYIEFTDAYTVIQFSRYLIKYRQHHFARSAPGRPEIH